MVSKMDNISETYPNELKMNWICEEPVNLNRVESGNMYWFPALLLFQTIKVLSFGFEMIWKSVNNDQTLTAGQNIYLTSLERLALYDSTVLCTCPYCVQMCAEPLSTVMNERSAKDEARWKNKRSTHGNIYPHSHQLNMCFTLSYLNQNHSHNTEYIQDMTWHNLSEIC